MARSPLFYKVRNAPIHTAFRLLIWLSRVLSFKAGYRFFEFVARLVWAAHPAWRRTTLTNLKLFFGDSISKRQMNQIAVESAIHVGIHSFEFLRMGAQSIDKVIDMVVEVEGLEHFERAHARGKGIIGLAMHYGNWELNGAYWCQKLGPLYAVGKEQSDKFFTDLAFNRRERFGIKVVLSGARAGSAILRALNENSTLGLLNDVNGGTTGFFAPFKGIMASNNVGPASLAIRTGSPLLVTYCTRMGIGKYKMVIEPPLNTSGLPEDRTEAIYELLVRINKAYERIIENDPGQWLWGHKRWKTRPKDEESLY